MKVINTGGHYSLYDDDIKTYDKLPACAYVVNFSERGGFYLERFSDIKVKEKVYGVHEDKVEKVLRSFKSFERSLGVILSGDKGIGKSLFAKMLSEKCIEEGYPLIIVNCYYPGIASFLDSIDQETMVLFDEFDKTFGEVNPMDGASSPQTELLSLFDGISQGKKLFVISCNNLRKISDFLVNRPGRFHYHFRFEYPTDAEITEYLTDKLEERYRGEIEKVIAFSKKVPLNYDCLRAIAFELSSGENFEVVIKDLNIVNLNSVEYKIKLYLDNGKVFERKNGYSMDLFEDGDETCWLKDGEGHSIYVRFNHSDVVWDPTRGTTIVEGKNIRLLPDDELDFPGEEALDVSNLTPLFLVVTKAGGRSLHYTI